MMFKMSLLISAMTALLTSASASASANPYYKDGKSFEVRQEEAAKIRAKHLDRIPVIVEKLAGADVPDIDRKKYLVPQDLTVGQFVYVVRKRIHLPAEKALFLFINNILPPTMNSLAELYKDHKDPDGFLYVQYSGENTFGGETVEEHMGRIGAIEVHEE